MKDTKILGMYKICFYVPASHLEIVKDAMFAEGAGHYGGYDRCCWQTTGQGQFRPLQDSHPFVGSLLQVELLEEYKVEMTCQAQLLKRAIAALLETHPYEQPAYAIHKLITLDDL